MLGSHAHATGVHIHVSQTVLKYLCRVLQGATPEEALDMDLALPLFQPQPAPEPKRPNQAMRGILGHHLGGVADMLPVPNFAGWVLASLLYKP